MYLPHKRYQAMGVLNVTPNSFSDGALYTNEDALITQFNHLNSFCEIIDIGAESTAPMNNAIDAGEELARFEESFECLIHQAPPKAISLDTYKPEVFYEVYLWLKKYWPKTKVIWNDVSGKVDDECLSLLKECPDISYVLCHNLAPQRHLTNSHMDYTLGQFNIMPEVIEYFKERVHSIENHLILDLCFGFSKSREQNYRLLSHLHHFLNEFSDYEHLIGISRKSFLRFDPIKDSKGEYNQNHLDGLQGMLLNYLNLNGPQFIYRVHNEKSLLLWDQFTELENILS
jgi:dihydropteroate synthase